METNNIYIVGAGFAGQMISADITRKKIFGRVKAFLDDDEAKIGTFLDGVPVMGPLSRVKDLLCPSVNDEAVIAIPNNPVERIREIYELLKNSGFKNIKILPGISHVISGGAKLLQLRDINPLDILGRTPVSIPLKESLSYLRGKRVMITGAGGSIGSELSRQLLEGGAKRLYLFGHGENSIYQIDRELRTMQADGIGERAVIVPIVGNMADRNYSEYIIRKTKTEVVFHAAAHKHVPMMEENPVAAIENNVFGTKNLIDAAMKNGVERFVLISTDKAVDPVSVYGCSKTLSEKLILDAGRKAEKLRNGKKFMFVRFGNVLGSRGSILPLFEKQIKNGGPITITTPEMERYFMTIPEACSLVLKTGGVGENGASYLLDMGERIKITKIAEEMIRFSALEPYKDIDIVYIGSRKGEREKEPLWLPEEKPEKTEYEKILKLKNMDYSEEYLELLLSRLRPICFLQEGKENEYRSSAKLKEVLCAAFSSLKKFYEECKK